ncbi:hypothetical protein TrST_g12950 [Triparma strigata]|uniref:Uncharacterized protein n=1 Tax=Triparma strigata TaxID=1606541 RepID=A0A9W7ETM6_9STRA|nr:hypothetical protein TrST_g12950 [Triparma strigata]
MENAADLQDIRKLLKEQGVALAQVKEMLKQETESKERLSAKVEEQRLRIVTLEAQVSQLSPPVQTGKVVRKWRVVFVLGSLVPHAFALASLKYGDKRFGAAARMFEMFGLVCSIAAAGGNSRNYGSWNEKLFIVVCSLSVAAYYAIRAYALSSLGYLITASGLTLLLPPIYLAANKLASKLSDRKLGAAATEGLKSLPGVLIPILYISSSSLRCIMDASPDDKIDEWGYIEGCENPSQPTYMVSAFLATSWTLTYIIPPLLPSHQTMTWSDVMELKMGTIEVAYEYVIKPAIFHSSSLAHHASASASVTEINPPTSDAFSHESTATL